ncbi:MAG: GDP-mannose 4,6-dehydratase [FCB group bacterium]|jgi:dTDP-glucose 4,6-dehydratase|nr:GDP-mannose 4,6-dehydratase [FCB group bacterium]
MKTLLVTGGAGFIGSNFVHRMWNRYPDYRIIVLDLLTYAGSPNNLPVVPKGLDERLEFWQGDVCNAELVDALMRKSDTVVHFAAESHVTRSIFDNRTFFMTDVIGTHTIANSVLKHRDRIERFVHISTSEVYGTAETPLMSEEHPLKPLSPYASAKCGADRLVWSYFRTYDIPAVIVRPFNNYGPRQHLEKVVPRFITSVLLGEDVTVHGDGGAARDFVFVEDNCSAIDAVLHAGIDKVKGETFNVGTGTDISIQQIADDIVRLMNGDPSHIRRIGNRPGQVDRHTADFSHIREALGWTPAVSWEDGLRQTIEWYQNNKAWWESQVFMRKIPIVTSSGSTELH